MSSHLFKPGESGNPQGRPKGAKSAIKLLELAGDAFSEADLADVIAVVFKKAKEGDIRAIEMILDRTIAKVKPIIEVYGSLGSLSADLKAARERAREDWSEDNRPSITVVTGVPDADDPVTRARENGGRAMASQHTEASPHAQQASTPTPEPEPQPLPQMPPQPVSGRPWPDGESEREIYTPPYD